MWLPLTHPQLGTWPATQAHALTGNRTSDPLVHRPALSPLSPTSQSKECNLDTLPWQAGWGPPMQVHTRTSTVMSLNVHVQPEFRPSLCTSHATPTSRHCQPARKPALCHLESRVVGDPFFNPLKNSLRSPAWGGSMD